MGCRGAARAVILFEMEGVTEAIAREAIKLAQHKLPVRPSSLAAGECWREW